MTQNRGLCFQACTILSEEPLKERIIHLHDSEGKGWQSRIDCQVSSVACFSKLRALPLSKCLAKKIYIYTWNLSDPPNFSFSIHKCFFKTTAPLDFRGIFVTFKIWLILFSFCRTFSRILRLSGAGVKDAITTKSPFWNLWFTYNGDEQR